MPRAQTDKPRKPNDGEQFADIIKQLFQGAMELEQEKEQRRAARGSAFGFETTGAELAKIFRARADAAEKKALDVEKAPLRVSKVKKKNPHEAKDLDEQGVDKNHVARIHWDNYEKERAEQEKHQAKRAASEAARTLRTQAQRDRWAADHLIPEQRYILRQDEVHSLFPDRSSGFYELPPIPLGCCD